MNSNSKLLAKLQRQAKEQEEAQLRDSCITSFKKAKSPWAKRDELTGWEMNPIKEKVGRHQLNFSPVDPQDDTAESEFKSYKFVTPGDIIDETACFFADCENIDTNQREEEPYASDPEESQSSGILFEPVFNFSRYEIYEGVIICTATSVGSGPVRLP